MQREKTKLHRQTLSNGLCCVLNIPPCLWTTCDSWLCSAVLLKHYVPAQNYTFLDSAQTVRLYNCFCLVFLYSTHAACAYSAVGKEVTYNKNGSLAFKLFSYATCSKICLCVGITTLQWQSVHRSGGSKGMISLMLSGQGEFSWSKKSTQRAAILTIVQRCNIHFHICLATNLTYSKKWTPQKANFIEWMISSLFWNIIIQLFPG